MSAINAAQRATERDAAEFDVEKVRADFPILKQQIHGHPLAYLDNAATSQKPKSVIEAISRFYSTDNANIHRGVHLLSLRATDAYEGAREKLRRFINAAESRETIFVRSTTEAVNLVARCYGSRHVSAGDEIVISAMEHHSNIVPWQMLCEEKGAKLRIIPITEEGELIMEEYEKLLGPRTRLVSIVHLSNVLGTVNPVKEIIRLAHAHGVPVFVDGAQSASHLPIDVLDLDCDFYAFSGHKLYGPSGIGVLYGKARLLEEMPPYQGGGDMISTVTFEKTRYNVLPYKYEAGTPNIAGAVGLGAAVDYLESLGMDKVVRYEEELLRYLMERLQTIPGVKLIGTAPGKASVQSFAIDGIHPHDIGTIVDEHGVAIRTGHHCAQPLMDFYQVPATARASLAFYNTFGEIDALIAALHKVIEVFK
ncbi:MAG TPA: cysteine desulfurase [Acidobacteriota bacterium]|nr:cysteine desulfurase [Acidobacteriota bacterium]